MATGRSPKKYDRDTYLAIKVAYTISRGDVPYSLTSKEMDQLLVVQQDQIAELKSAVASRQEQLGVHTILFLCQPV